MQIKLRASKISIETPKEGSETWVHITVQKVIRNNNKLINIIPRFDYLSFPLKSIGLTKFTDFEDPITKQIMNVSGYGIAKSIASVVVDKLMEKYGGNITSDGDLIL